MSNKTMDIMFISLIVMIIASGALQVWGMKLRHENTMNQLKRIKCIEYGLVYVGDSFCAEPFDSINYSTTTKHLAI